MIRALFLDVDGTLISFRNHQIPTSTIQALNEAHRRGVRLCIATGRAASDLAPLAGIPYDAVVALNGAYCLLGDGRMVSRALIAREDFERSMALSEQFGFALGLELDDGVFVNHVSPAVERVAYMVAHPVPLQTDLRAMFERGDCCQMCFYLDAEMERQVMAGLPSLQSSRWCEHFVDVNVKGVDKASGMASMLNHYGFAAGEAMAFGDGGNDVAMLRAAGIGVAMGNACAEAMQAADHITADIDDHGIRRALETFGVI